MSHPAPSDQKSAWLIIGSAVSILTLVLVGAGSWLMQQRQAQAADLYQQAAAYAQYRESTRPPRQPPQLPAGYVEAQQIREKLMNHPAVIPGPGFNAPGVQRTGLAIVEALDRVQRP